MTVNWNLLDPLITEAFTETTEGLAHECNEMVESKIWNWPRPTERKNKQVVFSPRDIVDTGTLKNSQEIDQQTENYSVIRYNAPYSLVVHEGAIIESADGQITNIPSRPFIASAVKAYKPLEVFENNLADKLDEHNGN